MAEAPRRFPAPWRVRVIANLNERARERQEREQKEGKEAIAREIAERGKTRRTE